MYRMCIHLRNARALSNGILYRDLTKKFLTTEIIRWPDFVTRYKAELDQLDALKGANKDKLWETVQKRVTEHVSNIQMFKKAYGKVFIVYWTRSGLEH